MAYFDELFRDENGESLVHYIPFSSVNGEGVDVMKQIIQSIAQAHTAQLQAQAQQE